MSLTYALPVGVSYELTCGGCRTRHVLTGELAVMSAEIATFVAAHAEHQAFAINADPVAETAPPEESTDAG